MRRSYFCWLAVVACFHFCQAQELGQADTTAVKKRASNEYIRLYDDDIKLRLGFSNSFGSFHIVDKAGHLDFTLSPNQRLRSTLSVIYKFIEIDLGYTPGFLRFNKDDDIRGKSKFFNFASRFYSGKWVHSLQYSKTKGFYVDKADLGIQENVLFPNFDVLKIGGSTAYICNRNFSMRAISTQSEWQRKSTGSLVPSVSYYFTQIKNGDTSHDNIYDVAAGPSYYYNWVIGSHFLISTSAYGGMGYNYTNTIYNDNTADENARRLSLQTQAGLTLGYNSESIYSGATASFNSFYYNGDLKVHVQDRQQFFEFYIGYRFKAPEKLRNFFDAPLKQKKHAD